MECPKCGHTQEDENEECLRCGLIFSRYRPPESRIPRKTVLTAADGEPSRWKRAAEYMFHSKDEVEPVYFIGRAIVLLMLLFWSFKFLGSSMGSNYAGRSFMHLVNLPFHEAGHVIFRPFGRLLHSMGGSLGQLIMPLVCTLAFLIHTRDTFGAAIGLWWTGESLLDIAPYMADARVMVLQLLGGNTGASAPYGFHDWNFILSELGLLHRARDIAEFTEAAGKTVIVLALLWGAVVLIRQAARLRT